MRFRNTASEVRSAGDKYVRWNQNLNHYVLLPDKVGLEGSGEEGGVGGWRGSGLEDEEEDNSDTCVDLSEPPQRTRWVRNFK